MLGNGLSTLSQVVQELCACAKRIQMQGSEEATAVTPQRRHRGSAWDTPFPYVVFSLSVSDTVLERLGSLNLALNPMQSLHMKLHLRASKR